VNLGAEAADVERSERTLRTDAVERRALVVRPRRRDAPDLLLRVAARIRRLDAYTHLHRTDKYLDTLPANQTARKALPPTTAKSRNRKMTDCPSYY